MTLYHSLPARDADSCWDRDCREPNEAAGRRVRLDALALVPLARYLIKQRFFRKISALGKPPVYSAMMWDGLRRDDVRNPYSRPTVGGLATCPRSSKRWLRWRRLLRTHFC